MYEIVKQKIEELVATFSPETAEQIKGNFETYKQFGIMSLFPMSTTTLWAIITEPDQSTEERKALSQLVIDALAERLANVQ